MDSLAERDLLSMRWRDALFAHWDVEPSVVDAHLPPSVDVATHDGRAWLGIVPFEMTDIRPRCAPVGLSFGEINLRTYVEHDGRKGVYFFNLDADDPVGVPLARWLFHLPYYRATVDVTRREDAVRFTSHRTHRGAPPAHFDATYRPTGEVFEPESGSLAAFLVENYSFFTGTDGALYRGDIRHDPWPLQEGEVTIHSSTLFEANGFERPEESPLVYYSAGCPVTAGAIRRVE
jgi:uncharacterized protein YqjF (DUF2071 family)